ncbi:MAG TPA: iron-containing alcohol dehydrogenase [Ktedonobacteraceae bacterium]|nr:iron-containing alcohol dehydrogenase [Ktedonobacteraceae bacterium]
MREFRYTSYAGEIIFGQGSIVRLGEAVDRFAWRRLMLCSTGSLRRNGSIALVEKVLGERLVVTYEHVQPHVPDFQVAEAVNFALEHEADAIIGLGGGSPIGMAKAVSFALEERRVGKSAKASVPTEQPLVPVIALPTTYAGSEMTPIYGITHHNGETTRKVTVTDVRVAPKLVMYDPLLTLNLPPAMTASTGVNALAHCIEALYSITRNPLSTAAASAGVRIIFNALPRCFARGDDLEARTEMLMGAYLAGTALSTVAMGLHHGLCHALGGSAGVPHGIANSIILPHAMRFNLDATASQLAPAAEAMGISLAGRSAEEAVGEAIAAIYALIGQMKLPQHLRDVGVAEHDLGRLAQVALQSSAVRNNPKPIIEAAQIESVLRAAW